MKTFFPVVYWINKFPYDVVTFTLQEYTLRAVSSSAATTEQAKGMKSNSTLQVSLVTQSGLL